MFLNVPANLCRQGLPEGVLTCAGYAPRHPEPFVLAHQPGRGSNTVVMLQYRLGRTKFGTDNAGIIIFDMLAPSDDPFLHRLPSRQPCLDVDPAFQPMLTLVEKDPLRVAPS